MNRDDIQAKHKEAGRIGGMETLRRHGRDHFREIGRRGAVIFWKRYLLAPAGQSDYAIISRATGKVIAFLSGRSF